MQSSYCPSPYRYTRRVTREVMVGDVGVGGSNPIRVQSMLTSDTRDTDACVKEALELAAAGRDYPPDRPDQGVCGQSGEYFP